MDLFVGAFDSIGAEDFIEFFPHRGQVVYRHTRHTSQGLDVMVKSFRAEEVAVALQYPGALWASFQFQFEGQPMGLLPSHVMARPGKWHRVTEFRFLPPGADSTSPTYVQWRMEDLCWVVSELGDETFIDVPLPGWDRKCRPGEPMVISMPIGAERAPGTSLPLSGSARSRSS